MQRRRTLIVDRTRSAVAGTRRTGPEGHNRTVARQQPLTRPLTSARRTLEVLDAIANFRRPFRAPELSAVLGWSRATTYQQLVTLVTAGWLERTDDGEYRLSVRAARLSAAAAAQSAPSERLLAVLQDLVDRTGEAATVALRDGARARVLWRVTPNRPVSATVPLSVSLSAHSASGQVLLAHLADEEREQLRKAEASEQLPADRALATVRKRGYALYRSRDIDGVAAVGAPVYGPDGRCVAALALTGPAQRFDPETATEPILGAATRISQLWSFVGDPAESFA
jgi:DNA-binding IclR family transcriptional regulator